MSQEQPRSLKAWRRALRCNQRDAARLLRLTQSHYSKIERGLIAPRPKIAKRLMRKTGVSLEAILGIAS